MDILKRGTKRAHLARTQPPRPGENLRRLGRFARSAAGRLPVVQLKGSMTAFRNITGQLVYTKVMEGYSHETWSRSGETTPTRLDGEKPPGVSRWGPPKDAPAPYPTSASARIDRDATTKHGWDRAGTRRRSSDRTNWC